MSTVLLIEDDDDLRETIAQQLRSSGYDVVLATNGDEGLGYLHDQGADLVITDLFMPQKEGVETIIDIRKTNSRIPVIAISGGPRLMSGGEDLAVNSLISARVLGANYTLSKPFRARELLDLVERCLSEED